MKIPGANVLNMALKVISKQTISYVKMNTRSLNANGQWVTNYEDPVSLRGSFQPLPRSKYEALGLQFQKQYYVFYVSSDVLDLTRDVSGDQIIFNGKLFQCESNDDWYALDGWKGVLCVLLGPSS